MIVNCGTDIAMTLDPLSLKITQFPLVLLQPLFQLKKSVKMATPTLS